MVNNALLFFIIAKFYSKSNFADYAYISSLLSILLVVGSFGTNEYLVKLSSKLGFIYNKYLYNVIVLRLIMALVISLFLLYDFGISNNLLILLSVLILHLMFEPSLAILEGFFRLYDVCKIKIVTYFFSLSVKVFLIISSVDIFWLNIAVISELLIISLLSTILLLNKYRDRINYEKCLNNDFGFLYMFQQSWPIALTGIMTLVYNRIDQVMLYKLSDAQEMASYSMAVKFSEIWIFLPLAVSNAYFVYLSDKFSNSKSSYLRMVKKNIKRIYLLNVFLAIVFSILSTISILIFLPDYYNSIFLVYGLNICSILITLRHYTGKCYYIEGFNKLILLRAVLGAIINICLNVILLPKYGGYGAVISTFISLFFISVLFDLFFNKTFIYFKIKISEVFSVFNLSEYKKVIHENFNGHK